MRPHHRHHRSLPALLLLLPLLVFAQPGPQALSDVIRAPRPAGGEWLGLYILGKKVGYAHMNLTFAPGSRDRLKSVSDLVMRANVAGKNVERVIKETRIYEARPGGRLLSFIIEKKGDGGDETFEGTATPSGVKVIRKRPGLPDEILNLEKAEETVEDADQVRVAVLRGKTVSGSLIDANDLQQNRVTTTLLPPVEATLGGVKVKLRRASTVSEKEQVNIETTLTEEGEIVEINFGQQMVARAEPEEVAKRLDQVELFGLTRVVLPKALPPSARQVPGKVTLVVSGLPERFQKDTPRQRFRKLGKGDLVEVTLTATLPRLEKRWTRPLVDPNGGEHLKATLAVESDKPEIRNLAKRILGAEKEAHASALKIATWVHASLEKDYGASADRATDILRQMKGDCTEHSLLAVSLMRAAGIPARRVDGVIYLQNEDGVPALYWHEWIEAYVGGGEWVQMDPTFGQAVADATHFGVGQETGAEIAPLIGQLRVVEVR
jgi:hypothetical protein